MLWPLSVGYGLCLSKCSWVNHAWMFCSVRVARAGVGSLNMGLITTYSVMHHYTDYTKESQELPTLHQRLYDPSQILIQELFSGLVQSAQVLVFRS